MTPLRALSSDLVDRGFRPVSCAAVARLISRAEHGHPEARAALAEIYKLAGRAHIIGITGVPGSGKSTLVAKLAAKIAARRAARSASSRSTRRAPIRAARSSATASA